MNVPSHSNFSCRDSEDQISLGWTSMGAFGQTTSSFVNAEVVADFVAATRPVTSPKIRFLSSFWTSLSAPFVSAEVAMA
ncbi:hypothetical protein [Prosthecobacter dejongeii]|uniref:Uncharacterized protein n=1 Tax=Prosthecobacter dejongeii TaxID=48465 RepID=A0A7W7YMQ2_9BACT|nr:hypothetical protein [Prosthecobacter dejongeii]MBB5039053.1 hypothetical protein [Prosthecobacter dejongeii]